MFLYRVSLSVDECAGSWIKTYMYTPQSVRSWSVKGAVSAASGLDLEMSMLRTQNERAVEPDGACAALY